MTKKGRPNKYETHVKRKFKEIEEWLKLGASEKEIWQRLGIVKSTFYDYKSKYKEFSDLLKNSREQPVEEIKAAMLKRAKGFQYSEKRVVTQFIDFPEEIEMILSDSGINLEKFKRPKLIRTEEITKTALPDVAAGLVLLQHWDKDDEGKTKWSRDPANLEIKKEELAIKKEIAENDNW